MAKTKTKTEKVVAHDYVVEDRPIKRPKTNLIHSTFAKITLILGLFVLGIVIGIVLGRGALKPEPTFEEASRKLFGEDINILSS